MRSLSKKDIISLKIRFNNKGEISRTEHPYIIMNIDYKLNIIEVIQRDSIKLGKEYISLFPSNCVIKPEGILDKDGFAQLDNRFTLENFDELKVCKIGKLSDEQFYKLCKKYENYQNNNEIDDNKIVHMSKKELEQYNPKLI